MIFRISQPLVQTDRDTWREQWRSAVPPQCRNVPITVDGKTETAFICVNQFVMMLQDGLLMEPGFFPVCQHFQKAGYHVVWLMRCVQDIHFGFLSSKGKDHHRWLWKRPTTNFGRWTSDNFNATILLQHGPLPDTGPAGCENRILERVIWAESDDPGRMIPGRTRFLTTDCPGTPGELLRWLEGAPLNKVRADNQENS